ncbi:hypothetical protein LSH36_280g02027 [Paralvinella palmiformis]|uniref:Uncharacterized protein n=1 Tax=Paralvinella palmiformis TaxID=53620 RepID=A0AAD9JIS6_9ANNE|nr:hypothetical protein LSH36_280g02027 [Paralvinella palmiformis]
MERAISGLPTKSLALRFRRNSVKSPQTTESAPATGASRSAPKRLVASTTLTSVGCRENKVVLDLKFGIVKGYSEYVTFIEKPTPSLNRGRCDAQAVIRIDFSGRFDRVRFKLQYDRPRLWTADISDSRFGDGYGGANGTTSNMAELHIYNRQMRIYGNDLPGHLDAAIDGGLLLKIVDDVIRLDDVITIEVSDERVEWRSREERHYIESKFLYTLSGQNTTYGDRDYDVYAVLNSMNTVWTVFVTSLLVGSDPDLCTRRHRLVSCFGVGKRPNSHLFRDMTFTRQIQYYPGYSAGQRYRLKLDGVILNYVAMVTGPNYRMSHAISKTSRFLAIFRMTRRRFPVIWRHIAGLAVGATFDDRASERSMAIGRSRDTRNDLNPAARLLSTERQRSAINVSSG